MALSRASGGGASWGGVTNRSTEGVEPSPAIKGATTPAHSSGDGTGEIFFGAYGWPSGWLDGLESGFVWRNEAGRSPDGDGPLLRPVKNAMSSVENASVGGKAWNDSAGGMLRKRSSGEQSGFLLDT